MRGTALCAALSALCLPLSVVAYPTEEHLLKLDSDHDHHRADAVKEAFQFAWNGYMKYAFPHDELHPVSNGFGDSRNGWGASAVDALSTALIMDLPDVVDDILGHIAKVDYSKTDSKVSLFETTIRYLAGMLSAYDLLTGPCSHLAPDKDKVETLLKQSVALADVMKFAFDTKSGVPSNGLWIGNQTTDGSDTNGIATIGTLILEWTRLSDLTGDDQYAKRVQGGQKKLLHPKPPETEPFDGLIGGMVDIETGEIQNSDISWGGGDDSFYEYLIKMFVYDQKRFKEHKDRWVAAVESSIKHLKSSPKPRPDLTYLAAYSDGHQIKSSGHLACFSGGNFILGGQVLGRRDLVDFGLDLVRGCRETYRSTATKIGPEGFSWNDSAVPDDQQHFYHENGFFITSSSYDVRPEVLESYYYAYRATGDRKYRDWVWEAFVAVNATTRTDSGFTAIDDVNAPGGGEKSDNQESFLFAELMKYAYITHNPGGEWQVSPRGRNKWVYNTEAHPVKVFHD